ncbi:MAG: pantoate--beta-alanine ligase [Flavisolibacter sp.]|nr:pantoate--beta-alanine ligase [Flavisolibacter sp.]
MTVYKKAKDLSDYLSDQKKKGVSAGFVPTMGALHQGHLALIRSSKNENRITVCSIFVNPTQFNNADDFRHYPVTIEKDIEALITNGCDILFLPSEKEIYPDNQAVKEYDLDGLETVLEGHFRPGHFQGVCQVVDRLLNIIMPDRLYLGQKDYQQCKVINKLIELTGKQNNISLTIEPTIREEDGLAMSSRNLRLSVEQRELAPAIFETLLFVKSNFLNRSILQVKAEAYSFLEGKGFNVDYFEIANADTLAPSTNINDPLVAVVAAYIGTIRLIDNVILN